MSNEKLLNVNVTMPLWATIGQDIDISDRWEQLTIEHNATGGPRAATITIKGNPTWLEAWLDRVGAHVVIKDHEFNIVWSGFINFVNYQTGLLSITRGPIMDVWNRVKVVYTPYTNITSVPAITGSETETTFAEDTTSQGAYGIREIAIAGGQLSDDLTTGATGNEAQQVRDAFLNEYKNLGVTQSASYGASSEPYVVLNCLGYYSMLDSFLYNDTNESYQTLTARITGILAADPNGILATGSSIGTNPSIITRYTRNNTAREILEQALSYGDASNNRWLFSFERDREAYYRAIPTQYEYVYGKDGIVRTYGGKMVYPWQILPGRWMYIADLVSYSSDGGRDVIRNNPAFEFIEAVSYTAPFTATISGTRITTVAQLFARKGISI